MGYCVRQYPEWAVRPAGSALQLGSTFSMGSTLRWAVPSGGQYPQVSSTSWWAVHQGRWYLGLRDGSSSLAGTEAWAEKAAWVSPSFSVPRMSQGVWTPPPAFMLGRHSLITNSKAIGTSTLYGAHLYFLPFLKNQIGAYSRICHLSKEFSFTSGMRLNFKKITLFFMHRFLSL